MKPEEKSWVVGLGEVLWDVFPDGKRLGGAPANFAFHASRQGCDGIVVSAVGADASGAEIASFLARKKLSALLARVSEPTGTVTVSTDSDGVASYVFAENCAWDNIPFSAETENVARRAAAVCFGSLAQRDLRSRRTVQRFLDCVPASALRVFDVNLRQNFYTPEIIETSLARCSILKINEDEAPVLAGIFGINPRSREDFFAALFEKFPALKIIVLTLGKAGSAVAGRDGVRSEIPADTHIRVVDTVGAGDAFTAGFVAALLHGADVPTAHRRAADLAGFVCSRAGAMPED
ncbi:MAG: carbohydrate kinase [Opitutales bacterium]|nr:carbohydrate kinase [Opitutales bacterium]